MSATIQEAYAQLVAKADDVLQASRDRSKIRIQVGSATCEHAAGSAEVFEEFRKHIQASGKADLILRRTGCTGRCSREPIVTVFVPGKLPVKYEKVERELAHKIFTEHIQGGRPLHDQILDKPDRQHEYHIMVCDGSRCGGVIQGSVYSAFVEELQQAGLNTDNIQVTAANCLGFCSVTERAKVTQVLVSPDNVLYRVQTAEEVKRIVQDHLVNGRIVEELRNVQQPISQRFFDLYGDVAFFNRQSRVALRNAGVINPESLEEYIHFRGFEALTVVLKKNDPEWVVEEVTNSNLRGRGGGGFPTGIKWKNARKTQEQTRYIICNADEGDPGAFMDRSMLESDPYSVIEGMILGGFAIGAQRGFFYVRAEYPLAIRRLEHAIEECRKANLLGDNILGSNFAFELEIRLGAGAFVCGEETALIHSIEGLRGQPRIRPPFPSERGLWGKPTVINNVETFANIPALLTYGSDWFKHLGTEKSGGTKVFALAGKVTHTGLVEVPMGTTLRQVVYDIGGGVPDNKELKAVQTGGPAGGCIPAEFLDTPVDFDTLGKLGSIMGSGGMIVLDESDCMVDVAKFFLTFCQDESCGKCTPCREGTKRMLEILARITEGKGELEDLEKLERLANLVQKSSLCGLGRAAPNPVLSTLKRFKDEYMAHVVDKKCPAKKCTALIEYRIDEELCVGCTLCARNCPVECIAGNRKEAHVIDQAQCIKCGRCFEVCRFKAVIKQ